MSKPLFIHIPKNAGTAISQSGLVVPVIFDYISDFYRRIEESLGVSNFAMYKHLPYSYLDTNILKQFDRRFAVVRNPWSRAVSMYNYSDKLREKFPESYPKSYYKITFKEFLNRRHNWEISPIYYRQFPYDHWANQVLWPLGGDVDILRYEHLNEDISDYLGTKVTIPVINQGTYSDDYRSYYDEESYQAIYDWYRKDIEQWGFTFESAATKNYWKL
jgi:hypothetical protein